MEITAEAITKRADVLFDGTERRNQEDIWQELAEFMLNNQSGFFNGRETPGARRTQRVYDSTAIQAVHDLAAAIHATVTNPQTQWTRFRFKNAELNDDDDASKWLREANDLYMEALNESNFMTEVARGYKFYVALANMVLIHEEKAMDEGSGGFNGFQFRAWHLSEVAWQENVLGKVDTIYRKFKMTANQISQRWGEDKVSDRVKDKMKTNPEHEFDLIHAIFPRDKEGVKPGLTAGKNRKFASVYVMCEGKSLMEESGYYEFPCYCVRWETAPQEKYGRGPGHIALPDVRTLNRSKDLSLHSIALAIAPPIFVRQNAVISPVNLRPRGVTVLKDPDRDFREYKTNAQFDITQFAVEELRNSIKSIFFLDKLFLPPRTETGEMTAFEIATRNEQMQRVLGPTMGRLGTEFLDPMTERGFNMMDRAGGFPPKPQILKDLGMDIEVEHDNQLFRAQKAEDLTNLQALMQEVAFMAQVQPEIIDKINFDGAVDLAAKRRNIPPELLNSDQVVKQIREQRAQMQQQQMQLDNAMKAADAASKGAQAMDQGGE